jgi:hypothetical protein
MSLKRLSCCAMISCIRVLERVGRVVVVGEGG